MKKYDLIVIGGGSGGIATANRAASYGAKVAVVEAQDLGGTCVNRGCVPKKVMWYSARIAEVIDHYGKGYGFDIQGGKLDYMQLVAARNQYVQNARNSYQRYMSNHQIEIIQGYARFVDEHTIEVNGEQLTASYFLIATGGRPKELNVDGAKLLDSSDTFFEWTNLPQSVAVVGAGYIAVELAGVLHALGVQTHLVVRHERPLRNFDSLVSQTLVEVMEASGIQLHTHTDFESYRRNADGQIECLVDGEVVLTVDRVIAAVGRELNSAQLGLENTAVNVLPNGVIEVNDSHQTAVPHIYAVGDVIGRPALTPVAIKAGRQVAEFLFNGAATSTIDYSLIPTVVFSHPAIGTVGLTEQTARQQYGDRVKVYTTQFNSMYPRTAGITIPSKFKLVVLDEVEKVIGLHGIGEGVDEMIQGFAVAMRLGATKADFDATIAIHPTGSEEFVTMR